jgi:hypothetical protein
LFFQSFCAASYGAGGLLREYLDEEDVVDTIVEKRSHHATQQVIDILNNLLQDNGRDPVIIS